MRCRSDDRPKLALGNAPISTPSNSDRASGLVEQPRDHARRGRLAAAGFADDSETRALLEREAYALHRMDRGVAVVACLAHRKPDQSSNTIHQWTIGAGRAEGLVQIIDLQQWPRAHERCAVTDPWRLRHECRTLRRRQQFVQRAANARGRSDETLRVGRTRVLQHLRGRPRFQDPALAHDGDAAAIARRQPDIVGDEECRQPLAGAKLIERVHDHLLGRDVEPRRRFVRDQ